MICAHEWSEKDIAVDADGFCPLCQAEEIERLQELLRGVGANRYWEGRWRDEKAENERLRAALKPFAELGVRIKPVCGPTKAWPPDASARFLDLQPITVGDFVAAADALEQKAGDR